jgi:hypothetical protein
MFTQAERLASSFTLLSMSFAVVVITFAHVRSYLDVYLP